MKRFKTLMKFGLIVLIVFPFIFIYLTIANSKDCSQIVIDTYELHSNIDIPQVDPINCYYDKNSKVRISIYKLHGGLDSDLLSIKDNTEAIKSLSGLHLLNKDELPVSQKLFIATGERWGRTWTYVYEVKTRRLWVELKY